MTRRRTAALGAAGAIAAGGAGLAVAGPAATAPGGGAGPAAGTAPAVPATAPVRRTTLVETRNVDGVLGHGGARAVGGGASGTITGLPALGSVLTRGETVYRVDDDPIPLLYGKLPPYRTLSAGTEGRDVLQFERNLRASATPASRSTTPTATPPPRR
nr:hypothetical protein [Actinomadura sp. WMMB 499]